MKASQDHAPSPIAGETHTPGPLRALPEPGYSTDSLYMVSPVSDPGACTASYCTKADAHLYAAAPELLAALRPFAELVVHIHPSQPDDGMTLDGIEVRHYRAAAAAVAKADAPPAPAEETGV